MPAQPLLRYVSTYYFFSIETGEDEEQEDLLHPEWGSAHFTLSGSSRGNIVTQPSIPTPAANVTGPTGKASRIFCKSMHLAGIGILPLGWHRLVKAPADRWANRVGDLEQPEFRIFRDIWEKLQGITDPEAMAALFDSILLGAVQKPDALEKDIEDIHEALADQAISSVTDLAEPLDMTMGAVSKHLAILEEAGLIERSRRAQFRPCRLRPDALYVAEAWLGWFRRHHEASFDRLSTYLKTLEGQDDV